MEFTKQCNCDVTECFPFPRGNTYNMEIKRRNKLIDSIFKLQLTLFQCQNKAVFPAVTNHELSTACTILVLLSLSH